MGKIHRGIGEQMKKEYEIAIKEAREDICKTLKLNYSKLKAKQKGLINELATAYIFYALTMQEKKKNEEKGKNIVN